MDAIDASVVLVPYLEPVVSGRRVVVLGDASRPLGPGLLERGARLVHVYDPNPARVAQVLAGRQPSRSLVMAPLPEGELAVRDGAFEAVVVPDLSVFGSVDEAVARARRLLAPTGTAVFATPNPEALPPELLPIKHTLLSYYELYDVVALQFPKVRMLGQAPFSGYVIADFAPDEEPDVVVDTSLLERGAEEPRWFIALGSQKGTHLDAYTIVQVPQSLLPSSGVPAAEVETLRTELGEAKGRLTPLQTELQAMRERVQLLEGQATSASQAMRERVQQLEGQAAAASQAMRDRAQLMEGHAAATSRLEELERELQEKRDVLRKTEARAGDSHVRAGQLEGKVRDLEEELRRQRDRAFRLSTELEEEKKQRTKAELELGMLRKAPELPSKQDRLRELETVRAELQAKATALTADLGIASQRIEQLERELTTSRARIEKLERELAASSQRIEQLERELAAAKQKAEPLEREIGQARARIEQLEREGEASRTRVKTAELSLLEAKDQLLDTQATERQARDRVVELERSLAERQARIKELDAAVVALQATTGRADAESSQRVVQARRERDAAVSQLEQLRQEHEREVSEIESALVDRARELSALRYEVAHRDGLVRELLLLLEEMTQSSVQGAAEPLASTVKNLRTQLDQLATHAAGREAELQRVVWKNQELQQKLDAVEALSAQPPTQVTDLEQALVAAHQELEQLRTGLQQERQQKEQALAQMRSELQAQSVLLGSIPSSTDLER